MSQIKAVLFWTVILVGAVLLWQVVRGGGTSGQAGPVPEISYSRFMSEVADGQVARVTITGNVGQGYDKKGGSFRVIVPADKSQVMQALQQHSVEIWFKDTTDQSWPSWILNLAPLILLAALWFFMIRRIRRRPATGSGMADSQSSQGPPTRFGP